MELVLPIARSGLSSYPHGMAVDEPKLRSAIVHMIAEGYAAVAEQDGEIVAYIGGVVQEHPYFERQQLCVLGWYSVHTGAGFRLFRMMMAWKDERPMIASVYLLANPDERLNRIMAARYGAVLVPAYWISLESAAN